MGLPHIQKELVAHSIAVGHDELVFLVHAHREEKHLQGGQNAQKDQKDFQVFAFIPDHGAPPLDFPRVRR